jgi:hypothetical protein
MISVWLLVEMCVYNFSSVVIHQQNARAAYIELLQACFNACKVRYRHPVANYYCIIIFLRCVDRDGYGNGRRINGSRDMNTELT